MTAHRFTKPLGIVVQAGDIVASFHRDLIAYLSLGFDHTKQAQALPGGPLGKSVDLIVVQYRRVSMRPWFSSWVSNVSTDRS